MRKNMVLKLVVLAVVSILMLIALASIGDLARERKGRASEVRRDIAAKYAGEQRVAGPIFAVTFRERWTERTYNKEKDTWYDKAMVDLDTKWVFPETFTYSGDLRAEERAIGIFKANVFQSKGVVSGAVVFPEFKSLATRVGSTVELVSANACVLLSDLRGLDSPEFKWSGDVLNIERGSDLDMIGSGFHAALPDMEKLFGERFEFNMKLEVKGMGTLAFVPIGDENKITLRSDWPHPSFIGDFLATERSISEEGFTAEWNVNGLATSAQQNITNARKGTVQRLGVSLVDPVNVYSMTDRALKYGFLFIFITFAAFFLFEMLAALRIHPVQYGFVGLAQSIFFLLLLSLSEHIGFGGSYLAATAATIAVISFYLTHVLKSAARGLSFGGLLTLLYAVLFALLQSEDHALVAGSALVFGLMALVMLLTRKVDWYAIGAKAEDVAE